MCGVTGVFPMTPMYWYVGSKIHISTVSKKIKKSAITKMSEKLIKIIVQSFETAFSETSLKYCTFFEFLEHFGSR